MARNWNDSPAPGDTGEPAIANVSSRGGLDGAVGGGALSFPQAERDTSSDASATRRRMGIAGRYSAPPAPPLKRDRSRLPTGPGGYETSTSIPPTMRATRL